jgi:hypothetical protein
MGKTKIITRIIRRAKTGEYIAPWNVRSKTNVHGLGKPTPERLGEWRDNFNESLLKGGCNEHIGIRGWIQYKLEVFNQKTGIVEAEFNPPAFEVIP